MKAYAGTSGFSYKEWKGPFYPEKIKNDAMLAFYSQQFSTVEINNTFYKMPASKTLETWVEQTPDTFRFSIKASQKITHHQRLKQSDDSVAYLFKQLVHLKDRLGPVLFQLPPYLKKDMERLNSFLEVLPRDVFCAMEFRNDEWFCDEVYDSLRSHNVALAFADGEVEGEQFVATSDRGYVRLRHEQYDEKSIAEWVRRIKSQNWKEAFVYFKHEDAGTGPRLAAEFQRQFQTIG